MKIYLVGSGDTPYDLPGEDNQQFEWVVVDYHDDGYEGWGEAAALCKEDGLLYVKNLGHCSCYGPLDGGLEAGDKYTVEKFLGDKDDILTYDAGNAVKAKVAELLSCQAPVFQEKFTFLE